MHSHPALAILPAQVAAAAVAPRAAVPAVVVATAIGIAMPVAVC